MMRGVVDPTPAPAPLLTLSVDATGCVRDADAAACAALGRSREALDGTPLSALIPCAALGEAAARFEAEVETVGRRFPAEIWASALVGGARTVMLRETPVAERSWAAWERAEAEARLAESEAQFRGLAENLPNLCWISGPDGRVTWANRRYREFYSWRMAEDGRIGESLTVHPDDREASQAAWANAYATGQPFSLMIRSKDAQGAFRPFLCQAEPVRDAEGRAVRWCGILTDLSEQQAREAVQRFKLELSEALRRESDPLVILRTTSERLGLHLGVDRVVYGEIDPATGVIMSPCDWAAPGLDSMAERQLKPTEDNWVIVGYRHGRTLACPDQAELEGVTENFRRLHEAMGATAFVTAPLVKEGRLHGLFSVYDRRRRAWTPEEVELVEEVGERTWEALWRARAEAASRESEAQFRTFAESLPDIAFVVAADGAPLWWNRRYEDYFGPGRGMSNIPDMAHPDDAGWVMEAWEHAASAGEPIFVEFRMKCLDGAFRLFKAHASPVKDEHGTVLRWAGLIRNIHEQRARENNQAFLLELGDRLRRLSDPASVLNCASEALRRHLDVDTVAFAEADDSGQVVTVVHEAANGVLPSTVGGVVRFADWGRSRLLQRFADGEPAILGDTLAEVGDDPVRGMYEASRVRATISLPLALNGVLRAVFFASHSEPRDWTQAEIQVATEVAERTWATVERARAEGAQRQTEALLTSIMTHAPVGIYVKDLQGRYALVNPEMCKLLGKPESEIVGRTAYDVVDHDYAVEVTQHDRWVMETGATHISERKLGYGQTGSYDWSLITRFPVTTAEGAPRQVAGINVNLSAQKTAEAELERSREQLYQSEKLSALGSLLAGVSHELNNPLSIVVAQATMMERQGEGGPLAERARHIRAAAERCARIVQTFLAMARQRAPERRRVDLNGVVDAALELTAYGLRTSGVQIVREQAPGLPAISADADQLHQVVINLVINAQHALAEQPGERRLTVRTAAAAEGGFLVLEIADNGPGVPEELRRRIFEPFFTTKPQDVGTGVGLSFSLGLVEAHGGRLELAETPGGGATLRVVLPISAAAEPILAPAATVAPATAATRTALVIDDEPQIARALAEFLELEGYACETAFGGGQAKARLAVGGDFDLILSDLRMPDVDGPALFAWIKAERPELAGRVAFSTGDTLGSTAVRFLAREGRPFMEKPFTPDSLRTLLDDVEAAGAD